MKRYVLILTIIFGASSLVAQARDPEQIVGMWKSPGADLIIKIDKIGDFYQGRIVWVEAQESKLVLDEHNPDERLQKMPLKGNKIIKELSFNPSEFVWEGGTFYYHKEGKLYNCHVSLVANNQMQITRYSSNHQDGVVETWIRQ